MTSWQQTCRDQRSFKCFGLVVNPTRRDPCASIPNHYQLLILFFDCVPYMQYMPYMAYIICLQCHQNDILKRSQRPWIVIRSFRVPRNVPTPRMMCRWALFYLIRSLKLLHINKNAKLLVKTVFRHGGHDGISI